MNLLVLEIVVLEKRNMNIFSICLILGSVSFSRAYTNYNVYNKDYSLNYCIFGNLPVCGTNGHEYFLLDNECELNKFNSKQLAKGQSILTKTTLDFCYPSAPPSAYNTSSYNSYCPQYCTKTLKPICGSFRNEQRNFTNVCEFKRYVCITKENWQIVLNDTCVAAACPLNGQEVCASFNGYTQSFPNLLSLYNDIQTRGKNWEILNVGPCPCPEDYRPICAQLNCTTRTFTNECFLEKEMKETKKVWSLLFYGECPEIPSTTPAAINSSSPGDIDDGEGSGDATFDIGISLRESLYGKMGNYSMHNKPVYIVKNDQINPYMAQVYADKYSTKTKDYYPSDQIRKNYKDSYKNPIQIVHEKPLYPTENLYKHPSYPNTDLYPKPVPDVYSKNLLHYAASSSPPDYQSFFKPLNAPISFSAISLVSSNYNNDYYAPQTVPDMEYQTPYAESYDPVSYVKMPNINYGAISYNGQGAYDSFT